LSPRGGRRLNNSKIIDHPIIRRRRRRRGARIITTNHMFLPSDLPTFKKKAGQWHKECKLRSFAGCSWER
jgi:hypothetical protein